MITKPSDSKMLLGSDHSGMISKIDDIGVLRKPKDNDWVQKEFKSSKSVLCIVCSYIFASAKILSGADKITHVCHPFRDDVSKIFPDNVRKFLLSESDFCDECSIDTEKDINSAAFSSFHTNLPYYDFVYFTEGGQRGVESKGVYVMDSLNDASKKYGFIGLVIVYGSKGIENYDCLRKKYSNLHIIKKFYSHQEVNYVMQKSKFMFFPNVLDASPRMITESLVRNKPIIVNRNILGGWKYVNEDNGVMFDFLSSRELQKNKYNREFYADQILEAFKTISGKKYDNILQNYYLTYGFMNSCRRLADIINEMRQEQTYEYVFYEDLTTAFMKCLNKGL